jgi:hypothetical protein
MPWVADTLSFLPAVDTSVGAAVYRGLSYRENYVALALAMIVALAVAIGACHWITSRTDATAEAEGVDESIEVRTPWPRWLVVSSVAAVALGALTMLPDLDAVSRVAQSGVFPLSWDTDNLLSWQAFAADGLRPMVDYFFPYGMQHVFTSTLLEGPLLTFLLQLSLLALLARALWVLGARRLGPPLAVVSAVVLLGSPVVSAEVLPVEPFALGVGSDVVGDVWRYLVPVVVALLFAGLDLRARRIGLDAALFGVVATLAMFLELALFGYAMLGVLAVTLLEVGVERVRTRAEAAAFARGLALSAVIPVVGLVSWFVVEHVSGRWPATSEWFFSPTPVSNASAAPTQMVDVFERVFSAEFVLVTAPVFAVVLAVVLGASGRAALRAPARYAAAIGAVTTAVVLKDLVRPAATAWLFLPLLLVIGTVALVPVGRHAADAAARALLAGVVVAVAIVGGSLQDSATALRELPGRVRRDAAVVVSGRDNVARAERARFASARFEGRGEPLVVDAIDPILGPGDRVYVLGDAQVTYALLRQNPYFHVTAYDGSPIDAQRRVVASLRRDPPAVVVWNPANTTFDFVPQIVRTPLVYNWVIEHYRPESSAAGYEILVPRQAEEPIPWAFWRRTLGRAVDLGAVAAAADLPDEGACADTCVEYLVVDLPSAPAHEVSRDVDVIVGDRRYTIRMLTLPGHAEYVVRLDRLWFWRLAHEGGITPRLGRDLIAGATARIVERPNTGALY